ncbi:MAG: zf-HC2 domain-containing protein [Tessaracoccus sp.]|uniref:zf-HC2 domain-containing protein n=1 Tax=Tessaracoccus sp. TaxID=1971211 RepID=UPI001ECE3F32|nr:zf-HC2 domain-containing protein [Tessaracoccus sp.]MBK7821806.1 zf-HC2 domain-containing protein [Tessaracoccus sp.]
MARPCCGRLRGDLSGYVDGTLPPKRVDAVRAHIEGCPECAEEAAALAAVCTQLSVWRTSRTPDDLTERLASIAGEEADQPLYLSSGPGELPSARRMMARRLTQTCVALLGSAAAVVIIAVLIAPEPPRLDDPVRSARDHYMAALSAKTTAQPISLAAETAADDDPDDWCFGLPSCPYEVAGMPLVDYVPTVREGVSALSLVYSDGVHTAVVGWTEGRLDDGLGRTEEAEGMPTVAVWQCGDAVVFVASDGDEEMLNRIMAQLPEERPYEDTLLDRISAGLDRLVPTG